MQGQVLVVGERPTYFPPFVNERFDGPPWWACTFASLLNGANVGWLGQKPATTDEIRALARASGDTDLRGGSQASHMIRAIEVRYGRRMAIERLTPSQAQARLRSGWALVGAVTYGGLPVHYRRWSPRFTKGHRVVVAGWDQGRTRLLDPLAARDVAYAGEWIHWSDFEPAWWSREQLWFREGMFAGDVRREVIPLSALRRWSVAAGSVLDVLADDAEARVVRRVTFRRPSSASFDAIVRRFPPLPATGELGTYLRVANGLLQDRLVDASTPGVAADLSEPARDATRAASPPGFAVAPEPVSAAGDVGARDADGARRALEGHAAFLLGRQVEWDRINAKLRKKGVTLPDRPAGPG